MPISILLFFGVITGLVYMLRIGRIGALVAFVFAGIISGPYVLNLFALTDTWGFLGDLGILFLWFNIGLEINIKRLWHMRHTIFGFGAAQVLMVVIMLFPILYTFTPWSIMGAMMVALLLATSSTTEDMRLLTERNELNTNTGRQTFSILLFQDLLAIPLLAMLPVFAGHSFDLGAAAIDIFVLSVLLIVSAMVIGRFIVTPLMRRVAKLKSREAFLLAAMLNIVIWAALMDWAGMPVGLGAFVAGMLMSETVYRHQISAEISPYAMLFMALFFVSIGLSFNVPFLANHWYIVVLGLIGYVAIKFMAIYIVARVRHVPPQDAAMIALMLAQGGEFVLLMLQTMRSSNIQPIPEMHQEILSAIVVLSIMVTPLLLGLFDYLRRTGRLFVQRHPSRLNKSDAAINPDVIVCGFGRVGEIVCQLLDSRGIPYVALDLDVSSVMTGRARGFNVVYGNTINADVLRDIGLAPRRTRAVVVALDNAETAKNTVLTVKSIAPRVKIFARARNLADSKVLLKQGAYQALPETIESSFYLGRGVLEHLGVSERDVERLLSDMRADNYNALNY